jgi:hypothetical protein
VIVYASVITYSSGHKEVRFSGRKNQFGGLKAKMRQGGGIAKLELQELHISAADFKTLETIEAS